MSFYSRLFSVLRRSRIDRDFDEEIQAHLEEAIAAGRSPEEVRRAFGSALRHREESRDIRVVPWLDALVSDFTFGWRQIRKNVTVSAAAVLSIALAIGSCTAAFRLIDALLLRPLPVTEPDQLFVLTYQQPDHNGWSAADSFSYPLFRGLRDAAPDRVDVLAISDTSRVDVTYGTDLDMEKATQQFVSGNVFPSFGLKPVLGRLLTPADDQNVGAHPYAVLSYDYWRRRFGGDQTVVGKMIQIGGTRFQIIGVAQEGFTGTEPGVFADIFTPMTMNTWALNQTNAYWFRIWLRLPPAISVEQVRERLQATFTAQQRELLRTASPDVPKNLIDKYINMPLILRSAAAGVSGLQQDYRSALMVLAAIAGLVLLIACANVANLLAAQAGARAREMALRVSIGAGRARLIQLMLVESALLAILASVLGGLFAWWSAPFVVSMLNPPDNPVRLALAADWRVLGFSVLLALTVTVFFGLTPALKASSVRPSNALKSGADAPARRKLMNVLVAAQVAFCFLVHLGAGLFVGTFQRLSNQPIGFSPDRILLLWTEVKNGERPFAVWNQVADHLRSIPGVESVAISEFPLMGYSSSKATIRIPGHAPDGSQPYMLGVSGDFFSTMRIPVLDGRDFRDTKASQNSVPTIVNEAFARRYFNGQNPVGKFFEQNQHGGKKVRFEIVGYARNARYHDMREPMQPTFYLPLGDESGLNTFIVRTKAMDPLSQAVHFRQEISRLHPEFRITNIQTQTELIRRHTIRERLLATLSLFFAAVALVLAGVGLYGVLSYSIIQRKREIGIRLALGAQAQHIIRGVTAEIFAMLLIGSFIGLSAGIAAERFIESLLYGVKATDLVMTAIPLVALLAAALLAGLSPTINAVRIDPAETLRSE